MMPPAAGATPEGTAARQQMQRNPPADPPGFSYVAWVFAIPASPLNSFHWCTGSLGAVVVMVTTSVIALMHLWVDPPEDSSVADRSQVRTIELTCGCGITAAYEHCDVIDEAQRPDLVAKLATGMIGHGCGACDRTAQSGFPTREHVVQAYEELTWVRHVRDRVVLGLRVLRARGDLPENRGARGRRCDSRQRVRRGPAAG
jgi:hypothetical protein